MTAKRASMNSSGDKSTLLGESGNGCDGLMVTIVTPVPFWFTGYIWVWGDDDVEKGNGGGGIIIVLFVVLLSGLENGGGAKKDGAFCGGGEVSMIRIKKRRRKRNDGKRLEVVKAFYFLFLLEQVKEE